MITVEEAYLAIQIDRSSIVKAYVESLELSSKSADIIDDMFCRALKHKAYGCICVLVKASADPDQLNYADWFWAKWWNDKREQDLLQDNNQKFCEIANNNLPPEDNCNC